MITFEDTPVTCKPLNNLMLNMLIWPKSRYCVPILIYIVTRLFVPDTFLRCVNYLYQHCTHDATNKYSLHTRYYYDLAYSVFLQVFCKHANLCNTIRWHSSEQQSVLQFIHQMCQEIVGGRFVFWYIVIATPVFEISAPHCTNWSSDSTCGYIVPLDIQTRVLNEICGVLFYKLTLIFHVNSFRQLCKKYSWSTCDLQHLAISVKIYETHQENKH